MTAVAAEPAVVTALRELLGDAVRPDFDARFRFAAAGAAPECVVEPSDVEDVVAAVRAARAQNLAVIPAGNGTHVRIGWKAGRPHLALSTRRQARILAHNAGDMTVRVEAGVTVADLNAALAAAGQWLPLDPPRAEAMTVGGLIAAGHEILRACVDLGGSITGEHGIGVEKIKELPLLFAPQDLLAMQALRAAFDPDQRCNPGKIFPTPGSCVEVKRPRKQVPA